MEIQPGQFEYAEAVDITAEQEKLNNEIRQSEENVLSALTQNANNRIDKTTQFWDQLGTFSKSAAEMAKKIRDERREEFIADINLRLVTDGVSQDLVNQFYGEREQLFIDGVNLFDIGNEYIEEGGNKITARDFQDMNKWQQHKFVEIWAQQEASKYGEWESKNRYSVSLPDGTTLATDGISQAQREALNMLLKREFLKQFDGINEVIIAEIVGPELEKFDEKRESIFAQAREQQWLIEQQQFDEQSLESLLLSHNPALYQDGYDKWIENYMSKYGVSELTARRAFVANAIKLVQSGTSDVTAADVIKIIEGDYIRKDGSISTISAWKEISEIYPQLAEASELKMNERLENRESLSNMWANIIRKDGDMTEEKKVQLLEYFKENDTFDGGPIPNIVLQAMDGGMPDYEADILLNDIVDKYGYIDEYQTEGISETVLDKYKDFIVTGTVIDDSTKAIIRDFANDSLQTSYGEADAASAEFVRLNDALLNLYVREVQRLKANNRTGQLTDDDIHEQAMAVVQASSRDEEWVDKNKLSLIEQVMVANDLKFSNSEDWQKGLEIKTNNYSDKEDLYYEQAKLGVDGQWKTTLLNLGPTAMTSLATWITNPDRSFQNIPNEWKALARYVRPNDVFEFVETQGLLLMEELEKGDNTYGIVGPENYKYVEPTENTLREEIQNNSETLHFLFPNDSAYLNESNRLHAYIHHNELTDTSDASRSIYNDPAFLSPELTV